MTKFAYGHHAKQVSYVTLLKVTKSVKIATLVSCEISGDFAYGHHKGELDLISVQNTSFF